MKYTRKLSNESLKTQKLNCILNKIHFFSSKSKFIQQVIRKDASEVEGVLQTPEQQDESIWKYEHVRQFCLELNLMAVSLQAECSPATCTQMTATEQWIFLCAAHKNPKECTALDYTRHTLDGAACLLNSNRYFPSRVHIKESSGQKLGSVCRRIYRIFSHAYFHHRGVYDQFERQTSLCRRFTRFVTKYELMTSETLIVPVAAVGEPQEDQEEDATTGENSTTMQHQSNCSSSSIALSDEITSTTTTTASLPLSDKSSELATDLEPSKAESDA